jgi:hypothetical protein
MADGSDPRGARVLGDDHRRSGGWWRWLLALLLLLAVIVVVALLSCGGGDDEASSGATGAVTTTAEPASTADRAAPAAGSGDSGGSGSDAAAGTLTAGGTDVSAASADLAAQVGRTAVGTGVEVQSVVDGGFFVGTSAQDRRYVEWSGDVGADEPARSFKPAVGDVVDLRGPVRPAPEDPATTLKLGEADAALVREQGAYVNASTVKAAS